MFGARLGQASGGQEQLPVITTVTWGATGVLAVVAAVADVRTRRVPNALTFGAAAAGMGYATVHGGLGGLESSVLGCLIGVGLFLPLFALGGMGGGDVKLLAAFGAWLGPLGVLWAAIWASLAGGILALAVSIRRRYLREALR